MATYYWVGGAGTWDASTTTNWATSSGGVGGAGVPTSADDVFFDAASGAVTVTISSASCRDLTCTGFTGTLTGSANININRSAVLALAMTFGSGTALVFTGTTSGTLTSNGRSFSYLTVSKTSGSSLTLQDALTVTTTFDITQGTFTTSNFNVTAPTLTSNNSNVRTINLGSSTVTLSGTITFTTSTNLTFNAGTSTITFSSNNAIVNLGSQTYSTVNFTSPVGNGTINGVNTFTNLTFSSRTSDGLGTMTLAGDQTVTGTLTIGSVSSAVRRAFFKSSVFGTARTITVGTTATLYDVDFRDITAAGAAGTWSGTRLANCGGNTNITFPAAKTVYWNLAGAQNWGATGWATSSGGTPAVNNFPLAQDTAVFDNTGSVTGTITLAIIWNIGTVDMSARTSAMTLDLNFAGIVYGSWKNGTGTSFVGESAVITFSGRSATQQISSNTIPFNNPITVDSITGTVQLQDAMTVNVARTFLFTSGTLDLNNQTLSAGLFQSGGPAVRTLAFGTGNITVTGTGLVFTAGATGYTVTGTPVVNVTSTGSTPITVGSGVMSESQAFSFNFTGGTYPLTFLYLTGFTVKNVDFTGYAGTLNAITGNTIYGNLKLSTGMTLTAGSSILTFGATSGTQTITSNNKTIDFPITVNGGSTVTCADALTMGSTRELTLTNGTLDLNGKTLTVGSAFTTAAGTKNLTFNGGTLACPSTSTTAFNNAAPTGFTTTAGTGTGSISMTSASAKTFVGGGSTYNCSLNQGGAGALTVTGANTFNDITNSYSATGATSILFTAGTTNTFSNWSATGTAGNLLTINSVTAATHTLSKASGIVNADYLSVTNSTATGGASWYAGANSTNVSGNTGWIFSAAPAGTVLAGVLAAALLGTPAPSADFALSGVSSSASVGAVTPTFSYGAALSGVSAAGSVGTLTTAFSYSVALTSVSASGLTGTATPKSTLALSGVLASGSTGTVTIASAYSAALSGASSSGSAGTIAPKATFALTGVAVQGQAGRFVFPLGSNQASGFAGTIAANRAVSLAGISLTAAVNSVSRGNTSFAISGTYASGSAGNTIAVYWKLIDDTQTANWQNIDNTQTANWVAVTT